MKEIQLYGKNGKGLVTLVSDEDYEELNKFFWGVTKTKINMYVSRGSTYKEKTLLNYPNVVLMHRQIFNLIPGNQNIQVDHADHDGLNNQRTNIRKCSAAENSYNKRPFGTVSTYKGISKCSEGKYQTHLQFKGKRITMGYFETETEAALTYNELAIKFYGEFAHLNIIIDP